MKIQYKSEILSVKSEKRYLCYRIEPSELSWWDRTFKNKWKYVYRAYDVILRCDDEINDCLSFLFSANEAQYIVRKYDTYEKLIDFLNAEYNKASGEFYKAQEKYYNENNNWDF